MNNSIIEKIRIRSWFNLTKQSYPYEFYGFIIDFENKNAYFEEKEFYGHEIRWILNDENRNVFNKIHYSKEIFSLSDINMDKLISSIIE